VRVLESGELNLLWSEIEWPLSSDSIQSDAVEFHRVISHIFARVAVVPFRLLTVFDTEQALAEFAATQRSAFLSDLRRLQDTVQMEFVIFFKPVRDADRSSGQAYLRQKAEVQRTIDQYSAAVRSSLAAIARDTHTREVNTGSRIFCLVERGQESHFHSTIEGVAIPAGLERRISGPWPPAEFLSDVVKAPPAAGKEAAIERNG